MGPETVVTLVAVGLIVAAIALYLIAITYNLRKASLNLRGVTRGVGVIHERAEPVGTVLGQIAAETGTIADALTALVAKATGATDRAPVEGHDAVVIARSGNGYADQPVGAAAELLDVAAAARARSTAADEPPTGSQPAAAREPEADDEWEEDGFEEHGFEEQEAYRPLPLTATPVGVHWSPPVRSMPSGRSRGASSGGTRPRTVPERDSPARRRRQRPVATAAAASTEPLEPGGSMIDLTATDDERESMSTTIGANA